MSALTTEDPAQDTAPPSIDTQLQQLHHNTDAIQQMQVTTPATPNDPGRKPKAPSVRRACVACHTGKTRCSEVLPCQSCLKRGLGASCAYPDPSGDPSDHNNQAHHTPAPPVQATFAATPQQIFPVQHAAANMSQQHYYDYNGAFTGASSSTFRPAKRQRNLTEEEAAAITRNFSRGDFYVGTSDHVHFMVGEPLV
ncbi:Zinc cluster transcription factor 63 [Pleurotus pulmonarius]